MARTPSNMRELGSVAPFFSLPDLNQETVSWPAKTDAKATVIMFICNHCPFVKHVNAQLRSVALDYQPKGIQFFAINSNDAVAYPEDSPAAMKQVAEAEQYPFPYLFDETQETAKNYQAACTPDFFIYDAEFKLVYRGQLDDSRPGNEYPVDGHSLRLALDALLKGLLPNKSQLPSIGCNIKWKPSAD